MRKFKQSIAILLSVLMLMSVAMIGVSAADDETPPVEGAPTYYVVGSFTDTEWAIDEAYALSANPEAEGEYMITGVELKANDELKVKSFTAGIEGGDPKWYPDGEDNNYKVEADGTYDIYFRPDGQGGDDWYCGYFYVGAQETPEETTVTSATEPVEGAPTYYVVGTFTDTEWAIDEAYALSANPEAEGEYMITGVELKANDELKVKSFTAGIEGGDPKWYPDGEDNNYKVEADGTYDIYFRPDGQGGDDWFEGYFYVAGGEQPTEPVVGAPTYYVVGTFTDTAWAIDESYALTANPATEGEYMLTGVTLSAGTELKVESFTAGIEGGNPQWYPEGEDKNYTVTADGTYDIYFRPDGQGGEGWFEGYFYVGAQDTPGESTETSETVEPVGQAGYYVVGSMTGWGLNTDYKMVENTNAEGSEYALNDVTLATTDQFKVVYTADGVRIEDTDWFPTGMGNNYGEHGEITADGTYNVYFRPGADGGDDWFEGCIYVEAVSTPITTRTVMFTNNQGWDEVYAYVFSSELGGLDPEWPGTKMTLLKQNDYNEDIFVAEVDARADFIIFTDNNGKQTENLPFYPGIEGYYYDSDTQEYKYYPDVPIPTTPTETGETTPTTPAEGAGFYLVGSPEVCGADWGWSNPAESGTPKLTLSRDGSFYYYVATNVPSSANRQDDKGQPRFEFKVVYFDGTNVYWHPTGMGNNHYVEVAEDGSTIVFKYILGEGVEGGLADGTKTSDNEVGVQDTVYGPGVPVPEVDPAPPAPATTIKVKAAKTTIYVGASTTVKATVTNPVGKTTFKSSNTKIATVNSSGKVVGKKAGTVTIKATNNGKTASVKIKVVKRTNPMTVKAKKLSLKTGYKTKTFAKAKAFTVKNAKGTVVFKKSKGNKKITVSKKGKVTVKKGLKKGTYKVTVKVAAKGNTAYKAKTKKVTLKVVIS